MFKDNPEQDSKKYHESLTLHIVDPGHTITLHVLNEKKVERSVCRSLFACACGRF